MKFKKLLSGLKKGLSKICLAGTVLIVSPAFGQVVDYGFVSGSANGAASNYTLVFPAPVSIASTPRIKYIEAIGASPASTLQLFGGTAFTFLTTSNVAVTTTNLYVASNSLPAAISNMWVVIQSASNLANAFAYQVWTNKNGTNIVLASTTSTNHNIGDKIYLMGTSNMLSVGSVTNRWAGDIFASRFRYPLLIRVYGGTNNNDIINNVTVHYDPN